MTYETSLEGHLNPTDAPKSAESKKKSRHNAAKGAWQDLRDGCKNWRIWLLLAYQDIKLRYRRSTLGPLWITLSMAITIYCIGFLYSHLFHFELATYFPFLAAGMIAWNLISTLVPDMSDAFIVSDGLIKQIKLPYSLYIHRVVCRHIIILFHNLLVMIPILMTYHSTSNINLHMLELIPGLVMVYINCFFYGLVLALIGARYRDIGPIIKSLIQVIFFVTPVMWRPEVLPSQYQFIVDLNPCNALIQLIRAPLLGTQIDFNTLMMVTVMTLVGIFLAWKLLVAHRARIIYWL